MIFYKLINKYNCINTDENSTYLDVGCDNGSITEMYGKCLNIKK